MRLNEIDDEDKIKEIFSDHFETSTGTGKLNSSVWYVQNGLIYVDGWCKLLSPLKKLPIKFGKVEGNLSLQLGNLETLEGCPEIVGKQFNVSGQRLTTLEGGPKKVGGRYLCFNNDLESLVGAPEMCSGDLNASYNPLNSLDGLSKSINGKLSLPFFDDIPLLRLLFVKNVTYILFGSDDIELLNKGHILEPVLNKYLNTGRKGALQCAVELTKLGFKRNARI